MFAICSGWMSNCSSTVLVLLAIFTLLKVVIVFICSVLLVIHYHNCCYWAKSASDSTYSYTFLRSVFCHLSYWRVHLGGQWHIALDGGSWPPMGRGDMAAVKPPAKHVATWWIQWRSWVDSDSAFHHITLVLSMHTTWCTSPVSVVWQCKLVSGWVLKRLAPPHGPCDSARTLRCF